MQGALSLPPELSGPPLIGHAFSFLKDPVRVIEQGLAEKGRVFSFRLGNKTAVVLIGPEYARFFFEQTDKLLSIREAYPFFIKMFDERLYFFADPEEYKEQRALILPCFQGKKMADYVSVMADETIAFMDRLGSGGEFELTKSLGPLVMNVAAAAFLGRDFRQRLGAEFFHIFREFSGGMEMILPLWLPIPRLLRSARAKQRIHSMLATLLAERRERPLNPPDFLQTLVDARYSDGSPLPEHLIRNLILMLVWAGHETTAGHVSWGIIDLLQNPSYLRRVLAEQDEVLSGTEELNLARVQRLKHMDRALKESERLHPIAFMLARQAAEDCEIGGYQIKKGNMVLTSAAISHKLPDVFKSPELYDPDRFGPERAEDRHAYSLIGFGASTHRCAGVNFAYQEMKVILTLLLQRYELELIDKNPEPAPGAVSKWPNSPCRVRYRLREVSRVRMTPAARAVEPAAVANGCPFHAPGVRKSSSSA